MHRSQDKFKIKRKIRIKSLEASICNVALFKSMKDKDFRDTIFISYCEEGVILQAISEAQWKKAHEHIEKFLENKKIELLIDGFDKDVYQSLINKGLKQITRKIRQSDEQCPYINIIHYQKLRKSCQYMDKQRYVEPLKDWEKKNKKNPNFAFLIVQPVHKFDEIKKCLLEHLLNQSINMKIIALQPINLMYLLFFSSNKDLIRNNCNRRQIEISIQKQESQKPIIKAINYTNIDLEEFNFAIVENKSKIAKSGVSLEVISAAQMKQQIKNAKLYCKDNPGDLIDKKIEELEQEYQDNFILVPFRKEQQAKYKNIIQKFTNNKFSKQEIEKKIELHKIYSEEQVQFMEELYSTKSYKCLKVCINNSPFMIHQYKASGIDIDTFVIYLEQLQSIYCSYLIRYYGLIIRKPTPRESIICNEPVSYLLVFDFHQNNLIDMLQNDMILDNMQIGSIVLQILYLINFLHNQEQPRCLGPIQSKQIFWPMATVLPYLGQNQDEMLYSIENDVKQAGNLMKQLIGEEQDEEFRQVILEMTNPNKYERSTVKKCIAVLQEMLCL